MTATEIIRKWLTRMATEFPAVRLRYQFDENAQTHLVEVSPEFILLTNENFKNVQSQALDELTSQFSEEGLCFIGPNDILKIEGNFETIHGLWSEVEMLEPFTFSWPVGFTPSLTPSPSFYWWGFNEPAHSRLSYFNGLSGLYQSYHQGFISSSEGNRTTFTKSWVSDAEIDILAEFSSSEESDEQEINYATAA